MSDDPICVIPPEICVICGLLRSTSPRLRAATLTFPWGRLHPRLHRPQWGNILGPKPK